MFLLNDKPIDIYSPYKAPNGVTYPHLRDPSIRVALGVVEAPDAPTYDDRFYWGVDNPKMLNDREEVDQDGQPMWVQVLGEVDGQPAMVDSDVRLVTKGLKSQWIAQVKQTAGSLLSQTDWMVIRRAERDVAIPADVVARRAAIVAEADRLEAAITACQSVEELISVVGNQGWPHERI